MNIFNKKTILFFSISTLMINGCVAKNEFETKSATRVLLAENQVQKISSKKALAWNVKKSTRKKEDCIDCYATPMANNTFAKVLKIPIKRTFRQEKVMTTKSYGTYDYTERASDTAVKRSTNRYVSKTIVPAVSYVNSSYGSYSLNTAIQVGAFRKYSGATAYKKRYAALSSRYRVSIRTGRKNNNPLYRVRIEGFKNKNEAKKFMNTYGLTDAFLVRK